MRRGKEREKRQTDPIRQREERKEEVTLLKRGRNTNSPQAN